MRFYSLGLAVFQMPVRMFWHLNQQIDRVRADEALSDFPLYTVGMGGEHVPKIMERLQATLGKPVVADQVERTEADVSKLKKHFG